MNSTGNTGSTANGSAVSAVADSLNGRIGADSVANNDSSAPVLADLQNVDDELPVDGLNAADSIDDHDSQELFMPR